MKYILDWLRAFRTAHGIHARLTYNERENRRIAKTLAARYRKADNDIVAVEKMRDDFNKKLRAVESSAQDAQSAARQMESHLGTKDEIIAGMRLEINTLTASIERVHHHYETQTKIEAFRAAAVAGRPLDEGEM